MLITESAISNILTRTSGFLQTVCSHSLQPYCGCALGNSLCGVGCYVQHNGHLTRGRPWGSFVEVRRNADESYRKHYDAERNWARKNRGRFAIFLSSSTEPFQPVERKAQVTRRVLESMVDLPPDVLILQSHSHHVADYVDLYRVLAGKCEFRAHVSIESDRARLGTLPPPASSVDKRMAAAAKLKAAGLRTVITVSPLLPIEQPDVFFQRLAVVADAVVIDHFIGGDGSSTGARTMKTALPLAMQDTEPRSVTLEYRDEMVETARRHFGTNVGVNIEGFGGKMLD